MKLLFGNRPSCVKQLTGIPVFVRSIYDYLKNRPDLQIDTTGCFLEKFPRPLYLFFYFIPLVYYKIILPLKISYGKYDFYLENSYFFIPLWKPKNTKIITMVYDIGFVLFDNIQDKITTKRWRKKLLKSIQNTDIIITISESSKKDIENYLHTVGFNNKPIYCIYCDTQLITPTVDQSQTILDKFGIQDDYFLFLGTLEPRKNPLTMIKAFHLFKETYKKETKLVIAGGKGWLYDEVITYIQQNNLEIEVIFTGYVSEEEKYFLLKHTSAFIFLSIYEGFGIPPLEALKIGTPCLLSDIPVFHELFEENALYVAYNDTQKIADEMNTILINPPKINPKLFEKFGWDKSASKLIKIMHDEYPISNTNV